MLFTAAINSGQFWIVSVTVCIYLCFLLELMHASAGICLHTRGFLKDKNAKFTFLAMFSQLMCYNYHLLEIHQP